MKILLEKKELSTINEDNYDDIIEIESNKKVEFGIADIGDKVEISFEFGTLKVGKKEFTKAVEKYLDRNHLIQKLG